MEEEKKEESTQIEIGKSSQQDQSEDQNDAQVGEQKMDELRTLWVGDIDAFMDETFVASLFVHTGKLLNVKIIRDKASGRSAGYGFVEFSSHDVAKRVLETHNGKPIPGTGRAYRLNWAAFGFNPHRREGPNSSPATDTTIYVGDLGSEVNDSMLMTTFSGRYPSVRSARIVWDPMSGASKGYGFVQFTDANEANRAMKEMAGLTCGQSTMRISAATQKKPGPSHQNSFQPDYSTDVNNTTVYVGGIEPTVDDEELRRSFSKYGEIISTKILTGRACGFVQYSTRAAAEAAFAMQGQTIGNSRVKISWGRAQNGSNNHNNHNNNNNNSNNYNNNYTMAYPSNYPYAYPYQVYPDYTQYYYYSGPYYPPMPGAGMHPQGIPDDVGAYSQQPQTILPY